VVSWWWYVFSFPLESTSPLQRRKIGIPYYLVCRWRVFFFFSLCFFALCTISSKGRAIRYLMGVGWRRGVQLGNNSPQKIRARLFKKSTEKIRPKWQNNIRAKIKKSTQLWAPSKIRARVELPNHPSPKKIYLRYPVHNMWLVQAATPTALPINQSYERSTKVTTQSHALLFVVMIDGPANFPRFKWKLWQNWSFWYFYFKFIAFKLSF